MRQFHHHEDLTMVAIDKLNEIMAETVTKINQVLTTALNEAAKNHDFSNALDEAANDYDFGDAIGKAVDEYNFDRAIKEAVDDYSFDNAIEEAVGSFDLTQTMEKAVSELDLSDQAKAAVERAVGERLPAMVKEAFLKMLEDPAVLEKLATALFTRPGE